ncbi:MAG TPA: futalosine hydrolase [Ferruginibacter sp.]|nr:futalosine hydrolase [Ferruginibacter sp.]
MNTINEICDMHLLIVAATEMEIADFLATKPNADVLITGVGAPHCIYGLTKKLGSKAYNCVIQAGIAGSFGEVPLGETVLVIRDCFADLGIFENNSLKSLFGAGFLNADTFPYKAGWLENESQVLSATSLECCTAITVNTVSENLIMEKQYKEIYQPHIETMEGAAFHYVCLMENLPFIQLRAISNIVGIRDKSQWKIKESVASLNKELIKIVNQLTTTK